MNWFRKMTPPGIKTFQRKDMTEDLWRRCKVCTHVSYHKDLQDNLYICASCDHHEQMPSTMRHNMLLDPGYKMLDMTYLFEEDPLKFKDKVSYSERLQKARKKNKEYQAVTVSTGAINHYPVTVAVQDFSFLGGSLGISEGHAITCAVEHAMKHKQPFVMVTASGGARMQEGVHALMQMARTTIWIEKLKRLPLPYIVVLTHPTTGGVTASYAMLGDIHIAEPKALIGFAGPRVIKQTTRQKLPSGFQRAEYLQEHGFVDQVVHRKKLRERLSIFLKILTYNKV